MSAQPLKLADARKLTPSVADAVAQGLRVAALEAIDESDVTEMMRAVVAKAKAGDVAAVRFVMDFLGKSKPQQPTVIVKNDANVQRIAEHLAAKGNMRVSQIAKELGLSSYVIHQAIDEHAWFETRAGVVELTADGWGAVKATVTEAE